jgi:hypothetical protein
MSRSPTGHGFWMPASIAGDTWPGVLATTLRSEQTSGLHVPRPSLERQFTRRVEAGEILFAGMLRRVPGPQAEWGVADVAAVSGDSRTGEIATPRISALRP